MDNIEQFSIYTAKIFEILYQKFPVPCSIDRMTIISDYLCFDKKDELKELKIKKDMAELLEHSYSEKLREKDFKEKIEKSKEQWREVEEERHNDERVQLEIYQGTIEFLLAENLISTCHQGGYRLTSKSFSHLNKKFKEGKLENEASSYIGAIKNIFSNTTAISKDVSVGVAVNIIPKLLGIS
ncbi:hypothetical protein [Desulfosediminicola ganghwensis]|uniref:hypothetical protein n=1 Tax=Desulfosediminicola ganghwensis TaxID=2569540 RepID=UPI0010AC5D69|nr:hypothetical protein [Desulfosediminicola ganghwensis]